MVTATLLVAGCSDRAVTSFVQLDEDRDGRLTAAETARDAALAKRFDELDADGNGELTPYEYLGAVQPR